MVGGLALMPPIIVALLASGFAPGLFWGILFLTALAFLLGFLDDRFHVSARWRLFISLLAALAALAMLPELRLAELRFSFLEGESVNFGALMAVIFTSFVLVGLQNAVNMADGKNGLVSGLCLIWAAFMSTVAPPGLQTPLLLLGAALALVLIFNLRGRLFLGDAGSYALSVLMGLLAIYVYRASSGQVPADLFALWFWLPVADCLRLIILRMVRGRSPFDGDRTHFHHVIAGIMPWRYGLFVYLSLVALPGSIALMAPTLATALLIVSTMAYALILAVAVPQPAKQSRQQAP